MAVEFRPISKTDPDNFDILYNGTAIGTFFWSRNRPKPGDKVAVVHSLSGRVAIVPDEGEAIKWLSHVAADEPDGVVYKIIMAERESIGKDRTERTS